MTSMCRRKRLGFTLIELLIVIGIILVLMAIIFTVISSTWRYVDEVRTRTEIGQLADACEAFKLRYGDYPPSIIVLKERGNQQAVPIRFGIDSLGADSFSQGYLKKIFTDIDLELYTHSNGTRWHDWNGNGTVDDPVYLLGDECLVFFLGGIPVRDPSTGAITMSGFCKDRSRPALPTPGKSRDGPFYEFRADRLAWPWPERAVRVYPEYAYGWRDPITLMSKAAGLNGFPVYKDVYGTPFAYFRLNEETVMMH